MVTAKNTQSATCLEPSAKYFRMKIGLGGSSKHLRTESGLLQQPTHTEHSTCVCQGKTHPKCLSCMLGGMPGTSKSCSSDLEGSRTFLTAEQQQLRQKLTQERRGCLHCTIVDVCVGRRQHHLPQALSVVDDLEVATGGQCPPHRPAEQGPGGVALQEVPPEIFEHLYDVYFLLLQRLEKEGERNVKSLSMNMSHCSTKLPLAGDLITGE